MKFLACINRPLNNYLPIIDAYLGKGKGKGKVSMTYQWNVMTFLDQDIRYLSTDHRDYQLLTDYRPTTN